MMTHLSDLEVKVMGHRWVTDVVAKHKSGELRCPATALICFVCCFCFLEIMLDLKIWHNLQFAR